MKKQLIQSTWKFYVKYIYNINFKEKERKIVLNGYSKWMKNIN